MTIYDDLSLLRVFVSIAESQNISAAARVLKLPQPTVSRHLKTLESRSGTILVQRDTHHMRLTDSGRQLLVDAREILQMASDAELRLLGDQSALTGHLRIFGTIDSSQSVLTRIISRFLKENPGITAELSYSNRPMRMIDEGFDVGVVAGEITDDRVIVRSTGKVRRCLVASPGLIKSRLPVNQPEELKLWPWLMLAGSQFGKSHQVTLQSGRQRKSFPIAPLFVSEGILSLREAALLGTGVTILPLWFVAADLAKGELVRLLPDWYGLDMPSHVVYPGDRPLTARAKAFVEFAVKEVKVQLQTVS